MCDRECVMEEADEESFQLGRSAGVASVKLETRDEFLRLARSYKAEHDANVERIAGTGDTGGMHTENIWYGGMTHAMDMMGLALGGSLYQEGFAIMRPDEWAEVCRRVEAGKAGV